MWAINHVNDLIIITQEWNKELWPFLDNSISGLFFNTTALLKHNLHTILLTHLKYTVKWLYHFTDLCSHHCGNFRTFHHPTKKPCTNCVPFHFLPTPSPMQPLIYCLFMWNLPILDISYKWNPINVAFVASFFYFIIIFYIFSSISYHISILHSFPLPNNISFHGYMCLFFTSIS